MPRKQKKSKEEQLAESFFPVDEDDVKYAIEKPYKTPNENSIIKIEKTGKKPTNKRQYKRKSTKTIVKKFSRKSKAKEFTIPNVKLKPKGYELIITEKPQAALKIASALGHGKSVKKNLKSVPYYEVSRQGRKIVVACAVGHLFTLAQTRSGPSNISGTPVFDIKWVPNYFVRKSDFSKKYYDALVSLVKNASSLTVATDYDVEGEVIGLNIIRFIAGQEDASRMKFSTLTSDELNKSYEEKSQSLDWGQGIAGETRHFLDWFYGINLSRALMNAIKTTGSFRIFSIGRVQGPSLSLIVQKERLISLFEPKTYWQVFITLTKPKIELIHNKDIFNKSQLKAFENLKGKTGTAETKKSEQHLQPNPPFNLTTLQTESYRLFGINPGKTLQIAQSLYLNGLISYPRTSSQKLPPSIGYKEILNSLAEAYNVKNLIKNDKPVEGRKSDPAHPSIYPTGQNIGSTSLSDDEKKVYELIVKRFLSLFMEDAVLENKTIKVDVYIGGKNVNSKSQNKLNNKSSKTDSAINNSASGSGGREEDDGLNKLTFIKKGSSVKKASWLSIYPRKIKEEELPDVNGKVTVADSRTEEKQTQPPKRYTPASLISELEKRNLGTKATRASILETLYDRGYVKGQSIEATPLGMSLIETLEKHSPIIINEQLTRVFEKEMESIQQAKKDYKAKEDKIIEKAKNTIREISDQFKRKEREIGKELLQANDELREQEREENKLNTCPLCKKGNLTIKYSKKTRRFFVACNSYPNCKKTYSLPPNGLIKKTDKVCDKCGFPILMRISKGKKPWFFCFNPECETNRERIEAYRRQQDNNS